MLVCRRSNMRLPLRRRNLSVISSCIALYRIDQICLWTSAYTACTRSLPRFTTACSIDDAYGTGASSMHSRRTGASSRSNACDHQAIGSAMHSAIGSAIGSAVYSEE